MNASVSHDSGSVTTKAPAGYLCHCLKVSHDQVREAIAFHGCETVDDVTNVCSAGGGCTACHHKIRAYLSRR
jgi:NAD(P)H-nitrite reductase large subunit